MRPPAEPGARALAALAALAPFLIVLAVREATSPGPASAAAAQPAPASGPATPVAPEAAPTPRQTRALEWIRASRELGAMPDPMARPPAAPAAPMDAGAPIASTVVVAPALVPGTPATPAWTITGLMGEGAEAVAIINDRIVRIGDEVGSGWMLVEVDARARTATLRHADGREAELTQVLPAPR